MNKALYVLSNTLLNTSGNSYINNVNLGIGTTSPNAKLHISHNGSAVVKAESTAGGYGAYNRLTTTTNSYDL